LAGPSNEAKTDTSADIDTAIPDQVKLRELTIDETGDAVVQLSGEFLGGIPTDPTKRSKGQDEVVAARVAQITYTLTSFEQVDSAKVISGGVTVEAPKDRSDFEPPAKEPKVPKVRGGSGDSRSTGTLALQQKLADIGYLPRSGVDGVAGYQTQQAVMAFQAWEGLGRDGVAGPATNAALRKAKRPKPKAKKPNRFLEVHLEKGVLLLVKNGRTKRAIHVSAGKPGYDTPTGRYRVFRKELQSWSYPYSVWLPYASYFNNGIAFHEYNDIPPYPASHGCVRVPTPEAKRVYGFAAMNRVVVVKP
ncbi:MAG: L,D-transpeptidase family protein, partial [Solirubrobacterales bacterium]